MMGSSLATPQVVKPRSLSCPNCGGPVELRGFAHTLTVVCPQCLSVLDASTPEVQILQTFQGQQRIQPQIPLGSRGKLDGTLWEVIGFQVREVTTEDDRYSWSEYLLFNPYKGFRYLSEFNGHWNYIRVLNALPHVVSSRVVRYQEGTYLHFDHAPARTAYVLGEFPWQVRVGEMADVDDFISPPYMLSSETMDGEITWSLGEYYAGKQLWQAFNLPGSPFPPVGVFPNQPSPARGNIRSAWRMWALLMVALVALLLFVSVTAARKQVFRQNYSFAPGSTNPAAFVTPEFDLTGRNSNVEIRTNTDLRNDWAYFNFALISVQTGRTLDFGREVSNYSDEGSPRDRVILPAVPSGKYYLRIEPEKTARSVPVNYEIIVRRDVPGYSWFLIAGLLLLVPPVFTSVRAATFESARWRESDVGSAFSKMASSGG